jgi:hypothetical protein
MRASETGRANASASPRARSRISRASTRSSRASPRSARRWSRARSRGARSASSPASPRRRTKRAGSRSLGALEREVRALDLGCVEAGAAARTDEDGAPYEERACLQLRCSPLVRAKWWRARQLARRVAGEALPPWQALEAIAAEALSAFPLEVESDEGRAAPLAAGADTGLGSGRGSSDGAAVDRTAGERDARGAATLCAAHAMEEAAIGAGAATRPAPDGGAALPAGETGLAPAGEVALPAELATLVAGLERADAFALDARLRAAVAREQGLEARIGEHLLRVAERRVPRTPGLPSLERYARERVGISPRKARGLLRLARAARRWPELHAAWRSGKLSWAKAQTLLPALVAAGPEEVSRWIERACGGTLRRLEEDVERCELEGQSRVERQDCAQPSDPKVRCEPEDACRVLCWGPADAIRLVRATLCTLRRRLGRATGGTPSEGDAFEAMLDHATLAWGGGDERVRRAWRVFARDGWRCTVPGCSSYRNLHDHHIVFRSAGGGDDESNRTTLCAWHHLRGVHAGRVRVRGRAPERLRFELGLREGREPLLVYGAGERLVSSASRSSASVVKSRRSTSGSSSSMSTVTSVSVLRRRFTTEIRRGTE